MELNIILFVGKVARFGVKNARIDYSFDGLMR